MVCTGLVLLLLIFAFDVTVAPEWTIRVVDEGGRPIAGAYVSEVVDHWTLDFHQKLAVCTDHYGAAFLPQQRLRASAAKRIVRFVSGIGPHSSLGSDVQIIADGLGYGDMETDKNTEKWHGYRNRMTSQLTLHKCAEDHTGYRCFFDYKYFFTVNSTAQRMADCLQSPGHRFDQP